MQDKTLRKFTLEYFTAFDFKPIDWTIDVSNFQLPSKIYLYTSTE